VSGVCDPRAMRKSTPPPFTRPQRILLVLARQSGDCRGKAIRVADGTEFRFESLEELRHWLVETLE